MPNYNLVVNSSFKPFTFSEYIAPYQLYEKEYKDIENSISDLSQKAGVFEMLKNNAQDAETYNLYKGYADDLKAEADALASGSAPLGVRRNALMDMRRRYSEEIMPIEIAYKARDKEAEVQRQAQLSDPTFRANRYAANTSLSDYIANPQLNFQSYSGQKLTKSVSDAALNLARYYMENPGEFKKILEGTYYERMDLTGLTPQTVLQTLNSTDKGSKILRKILDDSVTNTGVRSWYPEGTPEYDASVNEAYGFANMGAWSAIGQGKPEVLVNRAYTLPTEDITSKKSKGAGSSTKSKIETNLDPEVLTYIPKDTRAYDKSIKVIDEAIVDPSRIDLSGPTSETKISSVGPVRVNRPQSELRDALIRARIPESTIDQYIKDGNINQLLGIAKNNLSNIKNGVEYYRDAIRLSSTDYKKLLDRLRRSSQRIDFKSFDDTYLETDDPFDINAISDDNILTFDVAFNPMMPKYLEIMITDKAGDTYIGGIPYNVFGYRYSDPTIKYLINYATTTQKSIIEATKLEDSLTRDQLYDYETIKEGIAKDIHNSLISPDKDSLIPSYIELEDSI